MNDHRYDPAHPAPVEETIRSLFTGEALEAFDERGKRLASSDPAAWEGVRFPVEVAFELAAVCNLAWVMCPAPTTKRPPKLMEPALFERGVAELSIERGFVFLPQGFGETMLHPKWATLVASARSRGIGPIILLTNATRLDDRNASRLLEGDVDVLVVSIDGTTPETYASVRVVGDLAAGDTLHSIWSGPRLESLRALHRAGRLDELPICRDCRNWS